jgi:hypothetical protein
MTSRKPFQTQWVKRDEPKSEPPTEREQKAKNLPLPGPGIVVRIPLHLLPEYLALHGLTPNGIQEPKAPRRDGPGEATLLVTRAPARSAGERIKKGTIQ